MGKRRTIKIRGMRGKRHTKFPFFVTDKDRRELAYSKKRREENPEDERPSRTIGTS